MHATHLVQLNFYYVHINLYHTGSEVLNTSYSADTQFYVGGFKLLMVYVLNECVWNNAC